jgi:hypothetical protein
VDHWNLLTTNLVVPSLPVWPRNPRLGPGRGSACLVTSRQLSRPCEALRSYASLAEPRASLVWPIGNPSSTSLVVPSLLLGRAIPGLGLGRGRARRLTLPVTVAPLSPPVARLWLPEAALRWP